MMIGILAQKGLGLFSRSTRAPSPDRARLIELLDMMVEECDREANAVNHGGLMPDRLDRLARAAQRGHYRIEPERIAERILRH